MPKVLEIRLPRKPQRIPRNSTVYARMMATQEPRKYWWDPGVPRVIPGYHMDRDRKCVREVLPLCHGHFHRYLAESDRTGTFDLPSPSGPVLVHYAHRKGYAALQCCRCGKLYPDARELYKPDKLLKSLQAGRVPLSWQRGVKGEAWIE